jgi:hypothetical protein
MLDELLLSPSVRTFVNYLLRPETSLAVLVPGLISLVIVVSYARAGKISSRMQLLWVLAVGVSFYCARWELTAEVESLYIYSAFSVACVVLLFNRISVPAPLAYALTFLSLWWVDVTHALCRAIECGVPLYQFYVGVGGAGWRDALFLLPLITAAMVMYATTRIGARGERLAEL